MNPHCRILWAEDDHDDILLIKEACVAIGCTAEIIFVGDGTLVLPNLIKAEADSLLPSLIVLDQNLPKMSGVEVFSLLQSHRHFNQIPVIFFTTGSKGPFMDELREKVMVYQKPAKYTEFLKVIKRITAF